MPKGIGYGKKMGGGGGSGRKTTQKGIGKSNSGKMGRTGTKSK